MTDLTRPTRARCTCRSTHVLRACLLGGTLALLFWLKLRVVTGVPRTAIADPKDAPASTNK
jgi:hypothetical protein